MYLLQLFNHSIFLAFKKRVKIIIFFFLGILGIKNRKDAFSQIENLSAYNRISFHKTIWLNFRCLPWKEAKVFPIHVYTGTQIISTAGKIEFEDTPISFGMIKWGLFHTFRSQGKTRIQLNGTIRFKGEGKFLSGSETVIWKDALFEIGKSFFIGENVLIYCQHKIILDTCVRISYQCDICDSDFHYCINTENGEIHNKFASIKIGAYNWIGNKTTIKKGTKTPHHMMVASAYAVLSKDYTNNIPPYSVIGGVPAKLIKSNISRVWFEEKKTIPYIDKQITSNSVYKIQESEIDKYTHL